MTKAAQRIAHYVSRLGAKADMAESSSHFEDDLWRTPKAPPSSDLYDRYDPFHMSTLGGSVATLDERQKDLPAQFWTNTP